MTTTTTPSTTNERVWHASGAALYAGDIEGYMAFWQPDGSYEVAYPVAGLPPVVAGHEALRAVFAGFASMAAWIAVDDVRFHQTTDPAVAFVQERMTAELHDGSRYENEMCLAVTFRDGKLASIYEYYGQHAHADLARRVGLAG